MPTLNKQEKKESKKLKKVLKEYIKALQHLNECFIYSVDVQGMIEDAQDDLFTVEQGEDD